MSGQMLLTFTTRHDAGEDPLLQQGLALETEVRGLERVCIFEVRHGLLSRREKTCISQCGLKR